MLYHAMAKEAELSSQHAVISLVFLVKNLYPINPQVTTSVSRQGLGIVLQKAFQSEFQGVVPKSWRDCRWTLSENVKAATCNCCHRWSSVNKGKVPLEWQKLHDSLSFELECNPQLTSITKLPPRVVV
ncbi:hypothetical protein SLA2020_261750 [Shorea laevis]